MCWLVLFGVCCVLSVCAVCCLVFGVCCCLLIVSLFVSCSLIIDRRLVCCVLCLVLGVY